MFNNNSLLKRYYITSNTIGTSAGLTFSPEFISKGKLIIQYYTTNSLIDFNNNVLDYNELKIKYPSYISDPYLNIISQLVDIVNVLYNSNIDLKTQNFNLENALKNSKCTCGGERLGTSSKYSIVQDTTIDIVYLQYLLIYSLTDSNGIFIPSRLETARQILSNNGGKLLNLK